MYPLAFALVESENNNSWEWFLCCLRDCIGDGEEHGGWVFMSDRQKVDIAFFLSHTFIVDEKI